MVKALADRLAEAFAEHIHLQARRAWFEPDADPLIEDLHAERFRGIRPALGYPASPDHSQKQALFGLLDAGQLGMGLTESFAMTPAASVSGLIFAHPASRYFTVGRIGKDQAEDYAARRGLRSGRGRALAAAQPRLRPRVNGGVRTGRSGQGQNMSRVPLAGGHRRVLLALTAAAALAALAVVIAVLAGRSGTVAAAGLAGPPSRPGPLARPGHPARPSRCPWCTRRSPAGTAARCGPR